MIKIRDGWLLVVESTTHVSSTWDSSAGFTFISDQHNYFHDR